MYWEKATKFDAKAQLSAISRDQYKIRLNAYQ